MIHMIGETVIYRSKIDNGPGNVVLSPAMIIRTRQTTVEVVVNRWGKEPRTVHSASDPSVTHETGSRPDGFVAELPDDDTVDLVVFGLGKTYREYCVKRGNRLGQWDYTYNIASSYRAVEVNTDDIDETGNIDSGGEEEGTR